MSEGFLMRQWIFILLGGVLLGCSQPIVIESISSTPLDSSGLTGLLALVGWAPFFLSISGHTVKRTFWVGSLVGTIQHSIIFYWIAIAVSVFGRLPWALGIFLTIVLSFIVSAIGAAGLAMGQFIALRKEYPSWLILPFGLAAFEFVRNFAPFGGYPWGMLGNSMATIGVLRAGAAFVGAYGLLLCVLLINAGAAAFFDKSESYAKYRALMLQVSGGVLVAWLALGSWHIHKEPEHLGAFQAGLLQGNIEQGIKNEARQNSLFILNRFHTLQAELVERGADVIVWPEASVPKFFREHMKILPKETIQGTADYELPPSIVGGLSIERFDDRYTQKSKLGIYNAVYLTDATLHIKSRYNKVHLVPFGEYVPWPFGMIVGTVVPTPVLPGVASPPAEMTINGVTYNVMPTVCYEGVFPEITRDFTAQGTDVFFNMTNDAWYGVSSAPFQHFLMYSMRSTESGRPYIRVANTGVSGWVDAFGEIHQLTGLYETKAHLVDVKVDRIDTVYVRFGHYLEKLNLMLFLLLYTYVFLGARRETLIEILLRRKAIPVISFGLSIALCAYHLSQLGLDAHESLATQRQALILFLWWVGMFHASPTHHVAKMLYRISLTGAIVSGVMVMVATFIHNNPSLGAFASLLSLTWATTYFHKQKRLLNQKGLI